MGRRLVHICCYILFGIILMQCIGYNILSEPKFLMRSLSLAGAVLLILAETRTSTHTVFDLPTLGGDKPKVKFIILSLRLNTGRVQRASGALACPVLFHRNFGKLRLWQTIGINIR